MVRTPNFDPIEYLVERRFPTAKAMRASSHAYGASAAERERVLGGAKAFQEELWGKPPLEVQALVAEERKKEASELTAKAVADEQARFFNQPHAVADFTHWCKASYWTIDEAIALSFGKAPEVVSWAKVEPYLQLSPFAYQYARKRDLALRAIPWKQLFDPVLPGIFLAWAKRNQIDYPQELEERISAHGHKIADWKSNYDELNTLYDELNGICNQAKKNWQDAQAALENVTGERDALRREVDRLRESPEPAPPKEKELGSKERQTALKLVIGMAMGGYGHDPAAARSKASTEIASDLERSGVPLDPDTVRAWLKQGAELLPRDTTANPVDREGGVAR